MQIIIAGESQLLWSSRHPQGLSWWNEMHYGILCACFWQRFVSSPSLSVNSAVNGTLPGLRALSGLHELLLHKAGRSCLNYSLLCLSSLYSRQSPFILALLKSSSQSVSLNDNRMNKSDVELLCKETLRRYFCEQNKQQLIRPFFFVFQHRAATSPEKLRSDPTTLRL